MNPFFKSCLLVDSDSKRSEQTDETFHLEDFTIRNTSFRDVVNLNCPTPQLGKNMMRTLIDKDPYEVYELAKVLGNGSMGSVYMVKKREGNVGGSARVENLSTRKRLEMHSVHPVAIQICSIPGIGPWFEKCTGLEEFTKFGKFLACSDHDDDFFSGFPLSRANSMTGNESQTITPGGSLGLSLHNVANHERINKYLDRQRASGKYEPYYALKSIHLDRVHDPLFVSELRNEIAIMKKLDHPHIVRPIETYEYECNLYIVMELCSGGDLYSRDPYTEDQAARIVNAIMSAVGFMHEHCIIHRDIKYENVMFVNNSPKAEVKLIDFGLSKKYLPHQTMKEGVGTIYTMSPQVLEGDYNESADMWAIGVLAYMLLSSQMPFYGRKRREILTKIMNCEFDFVGRRWSLVSSQGKNFVSELLQFDPESRPTAEQAKKSLWLNMKLNSSVRTASEDDMEVAALSFEAYSTKRILQKLTLMIIAHKSTSEEIGFLRKVFKRYDSNKNGSISFSEFSQCLSKYGYSNEYMEELFRSADLDGTNEIKYTEFLAATIEATGLVTEERLAESFDRLDSDDSGFISFENLREILGDDVPSDYIDQIIAEADFDNDNKITYDEFLSLWKDELAEINLKELRAIHAGRTVSDLEQFLNALDGI